VALFIGAAIVTVALAVMIPILYSPGGTSHTGILTGIIGLVFAILALGVAAFAIMYSPGPPSYILTSESLTIQDRFYPITLNTIDVDAQHIRVVDLGVDMDWRPKIRMGGFANFHYRSGRFRVASGKIVRIYQADGKRLVLLPSKRDGTDVLVETKDPEKFVDEVRKKWSRHS